REREWPLRRYEDSSEPLIALEWTWGSLGEATEIPLVRAVVAYDLSHQCESPIEVQLGAELKARRLEGDPVFPQYEWDRFRMDFAILKDGHHPCVFVECDGKAFHSTPEQIANDRRKDQAAAEAGIDLYRFSGSDIFRNARGCATVVWA